LGKILACFFYSIHRAFVATEQSLDTDRGTSAISQYFRTERRRISRLSRWITNCGWF